jgi:hypothetical protein
MVHPEFEMLNTFASIFISEDLLEAFSVKKIKKKRKEWNIILTEKTDRIPEAIRDSEVSLNGYCKPLELMTYPVGGKSVYLTFKRRRWIQKGSRESYTNNYDLHYPGVKATKELADFLKGLNRNELDEFFNAWPVYRCMWEKDTSLVQRFLKRFQRQGGAGETS